MAPKMPASSVQGVRVELQQSEREMLEGHVLAASVSNVLGGIGAVLAPFSGAITAFVAAYLAGEIAEEAKEAIDKYLNKQVGRVREGISQTYEQQYSAFTAFLYTQSWPLDAAVVEDWISSEDLADRMQEMMRLFLLTSQQETAQPLSGLGTPAEAWSQFYPYEEMVNDAVHRFSEVAPKSAEFNLINALANIIF